MLYFVPAVNNLQLSLPLLKEKTNAKGGDIVFELNDLSFSQVPDESSEVASQVSITNGVDLLDLNSNPQEQTIPCPSESENRSTVSPTNASPSGPEGAVSVSPTSPAPTVSPIPAPRNITPTPAPRTITPTNPTPPVRVSYLFL